MGTNGDDSRLPAERLQPTRQPWPATLPEQVAAIAQLLGSATRPLTESELAAHFSGKGPWKKRLPQIIDTLIALGRAHRQGARLSAG